MIQTPMTMAASVIPYWTTAAIGRFHRQDRAGEAGHAQAEHCEDRAADRKIPALARGARRAEEGEGQRGERERIDRGEEAVVQFGTELARQRLVNGIIGARPQQLPDVTLADAERDVAMLREFRHVEGVAAEHHHGRLALADLEALQIAVLEHQERAVAAFDHGAVVGNDADALLGISAVVDENADQQATGLALADADGEILVELGKAAGLQDVGQHVGGDLGVPLLDPPHAVGREIGRDEGDQDGHHHRREERTDGTAGSARSRRRSSR